MAKSAASKSPSSNPYNANVSLTDKAKRLPSSPTKSPSKNNILTVTNVITADGTPFGYLYGKAYDIKEQLKALCNKNGEVTFIGGIEFKAFTNLSIKWIKESEVGDLLWVVRIDVDDGIGEYSFPMSAHKAYSNKIVRAIIAQKIKTLGEIEITPDLILTESNMVNMNNMFGEMLGAVNNMRDALLEEFIAEADDDLEQLI